MAKERLLVEVEKDLRDFAKRYAATHRLTLSELMEKLLADLQQNAAGHGQEPP